MRIIIATFICFSLICLLPAGCKYKVDEYGKYRMTDDMNDYEAAIDGLLYELEHNEAVIVRIDAGDELGLFSRNNNNGARILLLERAVPGLINALKLEPDYDVRAMIIGALEQINPDIEVVIPVYIEAYNNYKSGYAIDALRALGALKRLGCDMTSYVPGIIKIIESENEEAMVFGVKALGAVGRYAFCEIDYLKKLEESSKGYLRKKIRDTIVIIEEDYRSHESLANDVLKTEEYNDK